MQSSMAPAKSLISVAGQSAEFVNRGCGLPPRDQRIARTDDVVVTIQSEQRLDPQAVGVIVVGIDLDRRVAGIQRVGVAMIEGQQPGPAEMVAGQHPVIGRLQPDRLLQVAQGPHRCDDVELRTAEIHARSIAVQRRPVGTQLDRPAELLDGFFGLVLPLKDLRQRGISLEFPRLEPDRGLQMADRLFEVPAQQETEHSAVDQDAVAQIIIGSAIQDVHRGAVIGIGRLIELIDPLDRPRDASPAVRAHPGNLPEAKPRRI